MHGSAGADTCGRVGDLESETLQRFLARNVGVAEGRLRLSYSSSKLYSGFGIRPVPGTAKPSAPPAVAIDASCQSNRRGNVVVSSI